MTFEAALNSALAVIYQHDKSDDEIIEVWLEDFSTPDGQKGAKGNGLRAYLCDCEGGVCFDTSSREALAKSVFLNFRLFEKKSINISAEACKRQFWQVCVKLSRIATY